MHKTLQKRRTAVRASIKDIIEGKYDEEDGPRVVTPHGVELRRVMLVGYVVSKYMGQDGNFSSITLDDGTETIRAKQWGAEAATMDRIEENILAIVVGKIREYNDEVYIVPEIIREAEDPNIMSLHLLERYRGLLTRSGVSFPAETMPDVETTQPSSEGTSQALLTEKSPPTGELKLSGPISRQIVQYVTHYATPKGVDISDITAFFEKQGHEATDIQLKVIDLQTENKLIEVGVGKYTPADK